ncbi:MULTISPECIES: hypothetical protein [unclassified Bradyrhizobium]|nr:MULTISPECIES: hypothetical protein [unclassified Bradyrhizobium]
MLVIVTVAERRHAAAGVFPATPVITDYFTTGCLSSTPAAEYNDAR